VSGYSWRIRYRYEDEPEEVMCVFGRMTAEEALIEARSLLDATPDLASGRITNGNAGTYEILSVERINA
jgi:hypothetical protein